MRMHRWRAGVAAVLAATLLLAACGGDDDGDESGAPDKPTAPAEDPVRGGEFVMAANGDVPMLDPHKLSSYVVQDIVGMVYSRLLTYDSGPDIAYTDHVIVPQLAERYEESDDGLTYTFHLRDDVVWQNIPPVNGRPFVADDVVATMERIQEIGFQEYMLEGVTSIKAPDDHTVVFTLSQRFAPFLTYMANHHMWILPREAQQGLYDPGNTVIGTGPFMIEKREPNVETVFVRNPDYFEEGKPYLDRVRRPVISDAGARQAAFRAGEIHLLGGLSPEELELMRRQVPDATESEQLFYAVSFVYSNAQKPPFTDVRVRQAISHAIDRRSMGESIYGAGEFAAPVAPALSDWVLPEAEREELLSFDPDESRRLLTEAGFPDGFSTKLMVTTGYGPQVTRMAEWIVQDLSEVGIRAEIELVDYATYFGSRWPQLQYEMAVGLQTPFLEPDEWLYGQHHTDGPRNWFGISDPKLDEMLEEQRRLPNGDERHELVDDIQRYILEKVANPGYLWTPKTTTLRQPEVRDYYPLASFGYGWLTDTWLAPA